MKESDDNQMLIRELLIGDKKNKHYGLMDFGLFSGLRQETDYNWRIRYAAIDGMIRIWSKVNDVDIRDSIQELFTAKSIQTDHHIMNLMDSEQA